MNKIAVIILIVLFLFTVLIALGAFQSYGYFRSYTSQYAYPSFYINLDQDVENRRKIETFVKPYLPALDRVSGVLHEIGREGCRLAHINAQKAGLQATSPGQYYIILEDDAIPNVSRTNFRHYIERCAQTGADLILLNVQNRPETTILRPTQSREFYRIFGGTGSGLAYMVRHEFGKKLIRLWEKHPFKHIDWIWHELFPTHQVLLHRPLLFLHAQGESKTGDTVWRDANDVVVQDFDWSRMKFQEKQFLANFWNLGFP